MNEQENKVFLFREPSGGGVLKLVIVVVVAATRKAATVDAASDARERDDQRDAYDRSEKPRCHVARPLAKVEDALAAVGVALEKGVVTGTEARDRVTTRRAQAGGGDGDEERKSDDALVHWRLLFLISFFTRGESF
jgi:hypothetical protein